MKIDFHVHITPPDIIKDWTQYAKNDQYFSLLSNSKTNKFAAAEDVISMLQQSGFDRAVVFGFAFRDIGLCRYVNDYVIEKVKQYSDKLTGFAVVPPAQDAAKEIERCHDAGLRGVGELFPEGQEINLENKKQTDLICGVCKERNMPFLLHVNEPVGHYYPGKTNISMKQIESFVENNQGLKIILAHFGGGIFLYETMKELKEKFMNVYYDTAAAPFLYDQRIYNTVKALGICRKFLFASDFPLLPPERYFDGLEKSGLSAEEKRLIFGENAQKLLSC